jgi:fructosamine-3-kinase
VSRALRTALERLLGEQVATLHRVGGGDINEAHHATLANGQRVFVKTRAEAPAGMYAREAEGLAWLREAECGLRIPDVLAVDDALLALEWIEPAPKQSDFDEQLGRGLARLHRTHAQAFGFPRDNFIAYLPQQNGSRARWSEFYREQRLAPLVVGARARGLIDARLKARFDALYVRLPQLVGPDEAPARLHGDLWSGNVHVDERGQPVLIDPASYAGHREVDLAMLQLFGSPSARFFAAYDEVYPRAAGFADRVALYQLYPLLVHVHLFGGSYVSQLASTLSAYA